jgi:hypothetical protein
MFRPFLLIAVLGFGMLVLAGCQTAPIFATPESNWQTQLGQMHYANAAGRSVVGDFVARRSPDGRGVQLQFSSGPGIPLLKLSESGESGRAEGLLARGHWQGPIAAAPAALRNWMRLREVFGQLGSGAHSLRGEGWTATAQPAGAKPESLSVTFTQGGERFAFHFSR